MDAYYAERLVIRGCTFRSEEDANGAADRRYRTGRAVRHQRDHPDYHFAIGAGGRRREDAMQILRRKARDRERGRRTRGGDDVLRDSESGQRERD